MGERMTIITKICESQFLRTGQSPLDPPCEVLRYDGFTRCVGVRTLHDLKTLLGRIEAHKPPVARGTLLVTIRNRGMSDSRIKPKSQVSKDARPKKLSVCRKMYNEFV